MYHPTDIHIGRRLRERRVVQGLSQSELAAKLDISFQQVQKYESGANRISGSRLWDFCLALDAPVEWFFSGLPQTDGKSKTSDADAGSATGRGNGGLPLDRQTLELARALNAIDDSVVRDQFFRLIRAFTRER